MINIFYRFLFLFLFSVTVFADNSPALIVQQKLNIFYADAYPLLTEDGLYGSQSKQRVILYKKSHNIKPMDSSLSDELLIQLGINNAPILDIATITDDNTPQEIELNIFEPITNNTEIQEINPKIDEIPELTVVNTETIIDVMDSIKPDIKKTTDQVYHVGILAVRSVEKAKKKWQKLINYLSHNIPNVYLKPYYLTVTEMYQREKVDYIAVTDTELSEQKTKLQLDYLLVNPKLSVEYEFNDDFRVISTLLNLRQGEKLDKFGSVLISRADSKYKNISDMDKQTKIACVTKKAWGGWVLTYHYMKFYHNFDPFEDAKSIEEFGNHPNVIRAILAGEADVGSIRTDILENMAKNGEIDLEDIHVLNPNEKYGNTFKFKLTTDLYPEWSYMAAPNTSNLVNKQMAGLLLRLDEHSPVSKSGHNAGWTIPANLQGMHAILRDLRLPPYKNYGKITFAEIIRKYWYIWLSLLFGLLAMGLYAMKSRKFNRQLFEARQQQIESEKMAAIGQMVAGTAHEINTPLGYLDSNVQMIKDDVETLGELIKNIDLSSLDKEDKERIEEMLAWHDVDLESDEANDYSLKGMITLCERGITTIKEHILHLKNYSRDDQGRASIININTLITGCLVISKNKIKSVVSVHKKLAEDLPEISVIPSNFQQVINNLISNAVHAIEMRKTNDPTFRGELSIKTSQQDGMIKIDVHDNGQGIKPENIDKIFDAYFTTKGINEGVGLGLAMCKKFIEELHHGQLTVSSIYGEGTTFTVKIPIENKI